MDEDHLVEIESDGLMDDGDIDVEVSEYESETDFLSSSTKKVEIEAPITEQDEDFEHDEESLEDDIKQLAEKFSTYSYAELVAMCTELSLENATLAEENEDLHFMLREGDKDVSPNESPKEETLEENNQTERPKEETLEGEDQTDNLAAKVDESPNNANENIDALLTAVGHFILPKEQFDNYRPNIPLKDRVFQLLSDQKAELDVAKQVSLANQAALLDARQQLAETAGVGDHPKKKGKKGFLSMFK